MGPQSHHGNDLEADSGTVILATYRSILEESIVMTGYGNCQSFYIPDLNITVMFAHLSEFNGDNRGTEYEPGDFLCMTGLSGNAVSTNQHVHVEVYTGRGRNTANRVDPEPYLFGKKDKHPTRKVIVAATRDDYNADTVVVENSLDTADVYTPNESEIIKFREPKPVTYEHTFDISGYPDGLMTASGAVCTTIVFAGEPHFVILDSDEQPGQKLCGNHTFIVQTGGYSTLEETYNYTDHWNSECRSPDYYDFYDFDNWGIYEIDHIVRQAEQITVEGAVFHMPWNKDGIEYIAVLSDENTVCDTIDATNVTQTSDTRTDWTYTFSADEPPYGFAVKTSYLNSSIGYWPKARWARVDYERTFAYQEFLGCSGQITIVEHPAFNALTGWIYCDSLFTTTKEMERKKYQWGIDINARSDGMSGFVLHLMSIMGRTEPEPPFESAFGKFLIAEPYFASRYRGFDYPDDFTTELEINGCDYWAREPLPCDIWWLATCDGNQLVIPGIWVPMGRYSPPSFNFIGVAGEPPSSDVNAEFCIDWGSQYSVAMALGAPESFTITASSGGSARPETSNEGSEPHKEPELPKEFSLGAPRPNPFNTSVSFDIDLPTSATVDLRIYDILGNLVDNPIDHVEIPAGKITEKWTCENCPSGTY
jgi:hypothetical protein